MLALCAGCATKPVSPKRRPATPDPAVSTIGPLFERGLSDPHNCTASVLDSPGGNLILTAAHCLAGSAAGLLFAPGYRDGVARYGVWTVERAFADTDWLTGEDSDDDYAILQVANQRRAGRLVGVEAVTGGNRLGTAPGAGDAVTVVGYNSGLNDEPVSCLAVVRVEGNYPAFDCAGFSGGTSGGPWLSPSPDSRALVVRALIGGPNYGGCVDTTSYSSAFGPAILGLFAQAIAGQAPSILPEPSGDGC
jgi:V8-like Glu-specific endopeptidase